jgi:hypothetical protein
MTVRSTALVFSTIFGLPMTAAATQTPAPPPAPVGHASAVAGDLVAQGPLSRKTLMLRELDTEMRRSGRVAEPAMRGQADRIVVTELTPRAETKVDSISAASPQKAPTWLSLRDDPTLSAQYGEAFSATVGVCRYEVAQQLGVTAVDIEAGVVTFRWTIEPSGLVRDASVLAESPTNDAVIACAKRIVVGRVLLNAVDKPLALEWTYTFHKIPPPAGVQ